jgi:maltose/moltooligosaccharide transporter
VQEPREKRIREYALTSGELGAVAGQTVMVSLMPVLLARYVPSAVWIGFAVGGEGFFALLVPFWAGALSDRLPMPLARRFGRRTLFLAAAAPVMAGALALAPFLRGYWPLAAVEFVFFAALHVYLTPFWTLLIDAVPDRRRGRVQGVRGLLRAAGLAYGLAGAGLLFSMWTALPFFLAGALVVGTTALTWSAERKTRRVWSAPERSVPERARLRDAWKAVASQPGAAALLVANAFWNASVDGIRPYFFLYAGYVLGATIAQTSLLAILLVAAVAVGSLLVGQLADRVDRVRLLLWGSGILALVMGGGFLARSVPVILAVIAVAGLGAAVLVAVPYPLFARVMGERAAGEDTGIYVVSESLGRIAAPLLVGGAIDVAARWMPQHRGYPIMWPAAGLLAGLGWLALWRSARSSPGWRPRR